MTQPKDIRIATLLTCHNRCIKTARCIDSFIKAIKHFHNQDQRRLHIEIFLTDDGCTDNTVESVKDIVGDTFPLHIIKGNGKLFWSNGMIAAWKEALKNSWDYFLLLNDDVLIYENAISELFDTEDFCIKKYSKQGIYSGITCDTKEKDIITYGGYIKTNELLGTKKILGTSDIPQICDYTNANILLVANEVVKNVGIFYDKYQHSSADYDYATHVRKKGYPVLITANVCGECAFDHNSELEIIDKFCEMTLRERKNYFKNPLHSAKDQLTFCRRCLPFRLPIAYIGNFLTLYTPRLYRTLNNIRNNQVKS